MADNRDRAYYLDVAKVLSACLVVYWHTVFTDAWINSLLLPVRMPLFFLVAGFFARRAMTMNLESFAVQRVLRLVYVYVLWSAIFYFTLEMLVDLMKGNRTSPSVLLNIFVDPPRTIWFLYVLAVAYLIGYVTFSVPRHLLIAAAAAMYFFPDLFLPGATGGDLVMRICKLVPFFVVSLHYASEIRAAIERPGIWGPVCALIYFPVTIAVSGTSGLMNGIGVLISGVVGIAGLLHLLWRCQSLPAARYVASYGTATIYIFLLHRYTITACNALAGWAGVKIDPVMGIAVAALAVAISVVIGRRIIAPHLTWLERPVWDIAPRQGSLRTGLARQRRV